MDQNNLMNGFDHANSNNQTGGNINSNIKNTVNQGKQPITEANPTQIVFSQTSKSEGLNQTSITGNSMGISMNQSSLNNGTHVSSSGESMSNERSINVSGEINQTVQPTSTFQSTMNGTQPQTNFNQGSGQATPQENIGSVTGQQTMNMNTSQGNVTQMNQQVPPQPSSTVVGGQKITNSDEELLKAFVGKNYDKITKNQFNFAAFFGNSLYLFYRKMFLYGFLLFFINLFIINVVDGYFVVILYCLAVGICMNKFYLSFAIKKINKIKFANQGKDMNELKRICASKGGTSISLTILGMILEIILGVIILLILFFAGIISGIGKLFSNTKINIDHPSDTNVAEEATYEGVLSYDTNFNIGDEFSIVVPSIFENESDTYSYEYEFDSNLGVFNSCEVSLGSVQGYTSSKNLIDQMVQYHTSDHLATVSQYTKNGIKWDWFSYQDSFGTQYYYATTKDDKVYLLSYEVQEDASNECETYRGQIIDSIQKK